MEHLVVWGIICLLKYLGILLIGQVLFKQIKHCSVLMVNPRVTVVVVILTCHDGGSGSWASSSQISSYIHHPCVRRLEDSQQFMLSSKNVESKKQ